MKKKKWSRVLAVLLAMVIAVSLLSACGGKSAEQEDAETYLNQLLLRNDRCFTRQSAGLGSSNRTYWRNGLTPFLFFSHKKCNSKKKRIVGNFIPHLML